MLQRLIYFSTRDPQCTGIADLVAKAAESNRARGVTGLLIADGACFVQVLEGPRATLSPLFQSISRDQRHHQVTLAEVEEITALSYPDWGMTKLDNVAKIASMWRRVSDAAFDPWSMSARHLKDFLRLATFEMMPQKAQAV
jgi:hypothetical protein